MRVLREFHTENAVSAVAQVYATAPTPALRQDAIKTLTQLYHVRSKWDGKWWTPRPDTRGPYYAHEPWAQSPRVASILIAAIGDPDVPTAKMSLSYMGLVEMKEAVPTLTRVIAYVQQRCRAITEVRTAVLWYKAASKYKPDYYVHYLPTSPWIHQPFEEYDMLRRHQLTARLHSEKG